ncbi:MAG TPA: glycosyltransferase, partial [Verrucomicrobiae bacterium]|nr:glycosyltransferase [Verrucomicrobiae bacterium]
MPANRLYYHLKPYLPREFRMALRRVIARRKRRAHQDVWPINDAVAQTPEGWTGWPDGKKFAFVLTHDVEGPDGLAKCHQLMELEMQMGFRSSFNFVPEGNYAVSREQRGELARNGFEVGVHDLHHDGRLYWTRDSFSHSAKWINHYLKEWGAVGFRSGFMLRNLEWLHDLNIRYDASTFDTDPFEPQPDGAGTIFPFWVTNERPQDNKTAGLRDGGQWPVVSGRSSPGYVELPYTLPQDSTLFLILQEQSPEIWLQKLDWIVQRGGMALVNVHPDYLRFPGEPASSRTFPVAHYIRLLQYVNERHAHDCWRLLPREMADFCSAVRPLRPGVPRRRICMINYSVYRRDNRVIRYAEALAGRGDAVDVLALKKDPVHPYTERIGGVREYRLAGRYGKNQQQQGEYLLPLLKFWLVASLQLTWRHLRRPYDLVHVHNMPDFLVFAAWLPRLMGAKIILDVHDIMPEFYSSKFQRGENAVGTRLLKKLERASARFAHHVIISNDLWLRPFVARSAPERKCSVFINHVNQTIFYRRPHAGRGDRRIILFPGGLQWHQGLDIAIRAMPEVIKRIPDAEFHIYGDGNMKEELVALTRELGLTETVRFFDPCTVSEIAEVMSRADLGVVPKRADSFGNEAYSTKIMEFMSLGIPVVVSATKIDRFYFNDDTVRFFESGNPEALAAAIVEILKNDPLRRNLVANALAYADRNSWQRCKADYLDLVDALIENRPVPPVRHRPNLSPDAGSRKIPAADAKAETGQLVA